MTISLKVFPTQPDLPTWNAIEKQFRCALDPEQQALLGSHPALIELASKQEAEGNAPLAPGNVYSLSLAVPNTLGLTVLPKTEDFDEPTLERDYIEDFGRNLPLDVAASMEAQWKRARFYLELTSLGGRSKAEPLLLVALASAIAGACQGDVIVLNNDLFSLDTGIYSPEQFRQARPCF